MIDHLMLVVAFVVGTMLGTVFYLGLWWTIRRGMASPQPALWFFASLPLRLGIALGGLYVIGNGHGDRLLVCVLGFMAARLAVTWTTRPAMVVPATVEGTHASESG